MDTLETASFARNVHFAIATRCPTEFIDLTDRLSALVAVAGLRSGVVNVQTLHTTTAIVVNEHEPLLLDDFAAAARARRAARRSPIAHDDLDRRTVNLAEAERPNGHAHCRALLLPTVGLPQRRPTARCSWGAGSASSWSSSTDRASARSRCSMLGEGCR